MAESGLTILDGRQLRSGDIKLPIAGDAVDGKMILEMAEAEASARHFGVPLRDSLRSAVLRRLDSGTDNFLSMEFIGGEVQKKKIQEYLLALAEELQDDPIALLIFDGSALRAFLDDDEELAMMAESLFSLMDTNDTGKLRKSEISTLLAQMGAEVGVPSISACHDILSNILKRHGIEGEEQLGQAQFAQLLQPILKDFAAALAEKHVIDIQNVKVINGARLKKLLNDENLLNDMIGRIFHEWQENCNGAWNKETVSGLLHGHCSELGLPPNKANEELDYFYYQIFLKIRKEEKDTGSWNRESFQDELKAVLMMLAELLEAIPIVINRES